MTPHYQPQRRSAGKEPSGVSGSTGQHPEGGRKSRRMAFSQYPKLRRPSHPDTDGLFAQPEDDLVLTEKIDGNNFRCAYDRQRHILRYGSRNVDLGTDHDEIGGMFDEVTDYLNEQIALTTMAKLNEDLQGQVVLYGENAVQHTITDYDWASMPQFQLFDVYVDRSESEGDSEWLDWETSVEIANRLELETVPVIEHTTVSSFEPSSFDVPPSEYRPGDQPAEGVVIQNTRNQMKAKLISQAFAEKNDSATSTASSVTKGSDDVDRFLYEHVTERRIHKNIEACLTDPTTEWTHPVMEMMPDLKDRVWTDVWEEDLHDIIWDNYGFDLSDVRSASASKTASVLQNLVQAKSADVTAVSPGTGQVLSVETDSEATSESTE